MNQTGHQGASSTFAYGPATLELRGLWGAQLGEDGTVEEQGYAQLRRDRDGLVSRLRTLAGYAEPVGSGAFLLRHMGI